VKKTIKELAVDALGKGVALDALVARLGELEDRVNNAEAEVKELRKAVSKK
jgi:hypothetical protein